MSQRCDTPSLLMQLRAKIQACVDADNREYTTPSGSGLDAAIQDKIGAGIDLDDFVMEHGEDLVLALSASSETAAIVQVLPLPPQPETITTSTPPLDYRGLIDWRKAKEEDLEKRRNVAVPSAIEPTRETEYKRLLGEWLKKSEAHSPEIKEFKGGYQPFLERATRDFLAACERNEPEWP